MEHLTGHLPTNTPPIVSDQEWGQRGSGKTLPGSTFHDRSCFETR